MIPKIDHKQCIRDVGVVANTCNEVSATDKLMADNDDIDSQPRPSPQRITRSPSENATDVNTRDKVVLDSHDYQKPRRTRTDGKYSFDIPLQHGWIREVAARSRASSTNNHQSLSRPNSHASAKILRKEYVFYCTAKAMVPGTLSISESVITFEPDKRGVAVRQQGLGEYQVVIPLVEVLETAAVVLPRTRPIEDLFCLPPERLSEVPSWIHSTDQSPSSALTNSGSTTNHQEPSIGLLQILLKPQALYSSTKSSRQSPQKSPLRVPDMLNVRTDRHVSFDSTFPLIHSASYEPTPLSRILSSSDAFGRPADEDFLPRSTELFHSATGNPASSTLRRNSAAKTAEMTAIVGGRRKTKSWSSSIEVGSNGAKIISATEHPQCQGPSNGTPIPSNLPEGRSSTPKKPISFIMFRLSSAAIVKEVTRILLDLIDGLRNSDHDGGDSQGQGSAFVPHLSNASLNTLMTLCLQGSEDDDDSSYAESYQSRATRGGDTGLSYDRVRSAAPPRMLDFRDTLTTEFLLRPTPPKLKLLPGTDSMMSEEMSRQLSTAVPPTIALRMWQLLFDTSLHGVSLLSFYRHCEHHTPAFIIIRDSKDYVFGGYSPEGFYHSRHYYGTGEAFVFTFGKVSEKSDEVEDSVKSEENLAIKVSNWSGRDSFFIYSDSERIAFGGGGKFALALDHDLLQGNTGMSPTYNNDLLSASEDFAVERIQVWGFENL